MIHGDYSYKFNGQNLCLRNRSNAWCETENVLMIFNMVFRTKEVPWTALLFCIPLSKTCSQAIKRFIVLLLILKHVFFYSISINNLLIKLVKS